MAKPIIAVDIDDVLADSMTAVMLTVNKQLGVNLQPHHYAVPGDYWHYYESVWAANELSVSFDDLDEAALKNAHLPHRGASRALSKLAKENSLIVITSRNEDWRELTEQWLDRYFPGLIDDIVFAGNREHTVKRTKGEVCAELGAKWLIDDNPEHCEDAAKHGVRPILFGVYGWQHTVPSDVVHCKDWKAVQEYFDGLGR